MAQTTSIIRRKYSNLKLLVGNTITEIDENMLKGITKIRSHAFFNCTSLTSIEIPNSVTSISEYVFYGCSNLANVTIPSSVTSIDYGAFYNCTSLSSITIPYTVTLISYSVFYNCTSLTSVTVKSSIPPTLGNTAFNNTNQSLVIYVPSGSVDAYKSDSGWSSYASKIQAIPSE